MQTRRFKSGDVQRIFDRYEVGETVTSIAHSLGRYQSAIRQLVMRTGGVRPPVRIRSDRHLSSAEREEISRGLCAGESFRLIAARLGRSPSTISREVGRNRGPLGIEPMSRIR